MGRTLISPLGQYKINMAQKAIDSIVICLSISNKFKQNLMQNVDSAHLQQKPNISVWSALLHGTVTQIRSCLALKMLHNKKCPISGHTTSTLVIQTFVNNCHDFILYLFHES